MIYMSYERKFYIVKEYDFSEYGEVIAEIDLSNLGWYSLVDTLFKNEAEKTICLMENDYLVSEDKYGRKIRAEYPDKVVEALKADYRREPYWRVKVAIDLIKSILKNYNDYDRLMIYQYGY